MFNHIKKSIQYGHQTLTLETGEIARQAGGAVLASLATPSFCVTVSRPSRRRRGRTSFR